MKIRRFRVGVAALVLGSFTACSGHIGEVGGGTGTGNPGNVGTGGPNTGAGGTNSGTATGVPGGFNLDGSPQYFRLVRLTNAQWASSVKDVLNLSSPSGLEDNFETAVAGTTDFTNNELVLEVDQRSWEDFQSAAETLATEVTASSSALARVYPGTDAAGFIAAVGRRAYRRPLTSSEASSYTTLFNSGASLSGTASAFIKGAGLVLRAMLQSPYFLYRTELGAAGAALDTYEVASKLSLWLRGTTPSDALLDAAAGPGKLDTADGAVALATTMLGEPAAATVFRQFHGELLHFDRYATISKLNVSNYTSDLNAEYQDTSYLFFDKILTQGLGVRDILTTTSGFVGPGMARLYGVAAPASGYVERDFGPQRVGYYTQLPFLTLYAFNADPDPIHRGVSLNLDVLCAKLGPPAAMIPPVPPLQPGQTNRQRISTLTQGCGGTCHNEQINPLGFAFEHFDGMGQYRDVENGSLPVDSSGSYAFSAGTKTFANAGELMQLMADDPQPHLCYAKKLASFALQRDIVASDMPVLQTMANVSMAAGSSVKQMILELVRSDTFRTRAGGIQ